MSPEATRAGMKMATLVVPNHQRESRSSQGRCLNHLELVKPAFSCEASGESFGV